LFQKQPYPGKEKVLAFFRGINMQDQLGYKVANSTLGTRKDGLSLAIATELGFDATMEVVQDPDVIRRRKKILDLQGKNEIDNDIAMIAKQIDRDPTVKFSKDKTRGDIFIEQSIDLINKLVDAKKPDDIFDFKNGNKVKPSVGKYLEEVQDAVFSRWLDGTIIIGDYQSKNAIVKVLNKIPKKVIEQNKGDAFEVHGINVGIEAEGKYDGFKMLTREKREGGIPDFHASIFEALFNMEHKFGDSRGPQRGATVNFKTGKFEVINPIVDGLADPSVKKALKNGAKILVNRLAELGIDLVDSNTRVPKDIHQLVSGREIAKVADLSVTVDASYIIDAYVNKKIPVDYIEIAGAGLFYLNDRHGIAKELGIPKLEGNFPLKVRIKSAGYPSKGETIGYTYKLTVEPLISPEYITTISPISMFDAKKSP
jgi:hypothetical protein